MIDKGYYFTQSLMKQLLSCLYVLLTLQSYAQVEVTPILIITEVYPCQSVYATFVLKNNGTKQDFLLKVEADNTIKYKKPTQAIPAGGTDTLHVWYNLKSMANLTKR